ncbi:MAG: arsenate reductase ArsC [Candidatus Glassbacteria bacterium]|nr:arsenate reductase ArsC [Candidatus Glassbacteria bacterium]
MPVNKLRILFLCYGNACRSQMAEGWTRHLRGELIEPESAGIVASGLSGRAEQVMAEAGVDISSQVSNTLDEMRRRPYDCMVTLCPTAHSLCPPLEGVNVVHVPFDDPYTECFGIEGSEDELKIFRRVRDEIKAFVETLPESLEK